MIHLDCGSFLLLKLSVCHAVLSVHCSLIVTCWERANLLDLFCVMFSCVCVTFPCGAEGQVSYFIVSILDICLLSYFCKGIKDRYSKITDDSFRVLLRY